MDDATQEFLTRFSKLLEHLDELASKPESDVPTLQPILEEHLGVPADGLPVVVEEIDSIRYIDTDIALAKIAGRDPDYQLIGVRGDQRRYNSFAEIISAHRHGYAIGPVDRLNLDTGPDTQRATVAFGIHLFRHDGVPVVVSQRAENREYGVGAKLEVLAPSPDTAGALLEEIGREVNANSVLRGQVVTFVRGDYERRMGLLTFLPRPALAADQVILRAGALEHITRHVLGLADHRERLVAAGQHLKRGVLLYGPPGTGKTHTVRYLISQATDATVVLLSGSQMRYVGQAATIARAHQPAIVVIEDCDLIAEDRDYDDGGSPLLFTLLDAMDGLDSDADVVFLLTTNRAQALERALAQRPGRVDLAVEVPLPDDPARRRLISLYADRCDFSPGVIAAAAAQTEGCTASYAKELVRRAVLNAAVEDRAPTDRDPRRGRRRPRRGLGHPHPCPPRLGSVDARSPSPARAPPHRVSPRVTTFGGRVGRLLRWSSARPFGGRVRRE